MEIKIGIDHAPRELTIDSTVDHKAIEAQVAEAIENGSVLRLRDRKGTEHIVPGGKIAYVEIGHENTRPVGFGAL
ncbi:DUF3107 domain-containing protein [Falsarthrobacter nasiphocae]|uniref:DUF3107 domain-containing protein n=1 Tax=Falsarthrobacter nasiphocae TaxID=189863 RepID=A0AAE3YDN6_9MICC|nr:DUF3107 domain-containing protein [Falsarthrobacter nasiphocae]MDR6891464.1 hypothetical protein [Falsarthrobacter nasiphocae]